MAESSSLPFFSGLQKRKQSEYCRVPGSFPKKREKKRWNKWCPDEPRAKRQRIPDHRHPGEKEKRRSEAAELRERRFGHFLSFRNKPSESSGSHGTRSIHERCREEKRGRASRESRLIGNHRRFTRSRKNRGREKGTQRDAKQAEVPKVRGEIHECVAFQNEEVSLSEE